ncbi:peptide-methionine (R)-S-oxide reductase MsrB [Candidatus Gracilibacteria bacterium]|nr:peptide-methionine (R)-S-oxide reductase MsrB [Candidatus Gracilibacteria bacterium]
MHNTAKYFKVRQVILSSLILLSLGVFSTVSADMSNRLSENDQNFYEQIQDEFGPSFVSTVDSALDEYKDRMNMLRFSEEKKLESHQQVIQKVDTMIQDLLIQYPQDSVLPSDVNQRYMILSYLKFELQMLNFSEDTLSDADQELRDRLTSVQYEVTQNGATETPFKNEYFDNFEAGIYVDIINGEALFSSTDKFKTNTGWPAFAKPISDSVVSEFEDLRYDMVRTEVRGFESDSHLGHIFTDGPDELGGLRYCINSASLKFIPVEDMQAEGYGDYLYLFE